MTKPSFTQVIGLSFSRNYYIEKSVFLVYFSLSVFITARISHETVRKVTQMYEETELSNEKVTSHLFGRSYGKYVIAN
jgi:hypothetical protein